MDSVPRVRHQCASRAITPPFLAPAAARRTGVFT
jgi:hypothetical protein